MIFTVIANVMHMYNYMHLIICAVIACEITLIVMRNPILAQERDHNRAQAFDSSARRYKYEM